MRRRALQILRRLGAMHAIDYVHFLVDKLRNARKNCAFRAAHPGVDLPPDYILYESFRLDYQRYYHGGRSTAEWLIHLLSGHTSLEDKSILDWGCGPGRIVRHLPALLPGARVYGTDYNPATIQWCSGHVPGVEFETNGLVPPTRYHDRFFDVVYGISVLTHLSEDSHSQWIDELQRITALQGVVLLTTHGADFRHLLTTAELEKYKSGQLVVRSQAREGHRVFTAFHPVEYMHALFAGRFTVLDHVAQPVAADGRSEQDVWILRRSANTT